MLSLLLTLSLSSPPGDAVPVHVDPRVELLTLVFRLAGASEFDMPASRSPYAEEVELWFGPARDHEVFRLARALRAEHGIGFNAVPDLAVHLTPPPELALRMPLDPWPARLDERWRGADVEGFLVALRDFAEVTEFQQFLENFADVQRAAEQDLAARVREAHVLEWLDEFFGLETGTSYVAVPGLLCGSGNYGASVRFPDGRLELWPVLGAATWGPEGLPAYSSSVVPTVVHEFTHAFANPVVEAHWDALAPSFERLFPSVREVMARQAYGDAKTVACESLVRACVARHAARYQGTTAYSQRLETEVSRGFRWTPELSELLARYEAERDRYPDLQAFAPEIAKLFERLAAAEPAADATGEEPRGR